MDEFWHGQRWRLQLGRGNVPSRATTWPSFRARWAEIAEVNRTNDQVGPVARGDRAAVDQTVMAGRDQGRVADGRRRQEPAGHDPAQQAIDVAALAGRRERCRR